MKVVLLDFDGVMDTVEYCHFLESIGMPICDRHGTIFDSHCVFNLKRILLLSICQFANLPSLCPAFFYVGIDTTIFF